MDWKGKVVHKEGALGAEHGEEVRVFNPRCTPFVAGRINRRPELIDEVSKKINRFTKHIAKYETADETSAKPTAKPKHAVEASRSK